MADGSVVIGISLDTTSLMQSVTSVEAQIRSLGERINASMAQSFAGEGMAASMAAAMNGIAQTVTMVAQNLTTTMQTAATNAIAAFGAAPWASAGQTAAAGIASGFSSGSGAIGVAARSVAAEARAAFSSGGWSSIGSNMMAGVASGIRAAGAEVVASIRQVSAEAEDAVRSYYRISSPSALMRDEVGVMIARGMAEGILDGASYVRGAMAAVSPTAVGAVGGATSSVSGGRAVTQNIYLQADMQSPYRTARRIRRESEAIFRV